MAPPPVIGTTNGPQGRDVFLASTHEVAEPVEATPEWMQLPTDQWPQILLHNDGTFRSQAYAQSTTCLLIEASDGDVWLATPTAFLGETGGVAPPVKPSDLRRALVRWNAVSPINGERIAEIKNGHSFASRSNADCVLMKVPASDRLSTVKTLLLRTTSVEADETLYVVAHPSVDGTTQLVFTAKVTSSSNGANFRFVLEKSTDATGFLGGALVDHSGRLAGIIIAGTSRGQCTAASATALAELIDDQS
jgi:hypothetical protein